MSRKLSGKALAEHEDKRDVWQEVLDSVDEIKAGGGKRYAMVPQTEAARARLKTGLSQTEFAELLGVSKRMLEQWEQGKCELFVAKLCLRFPPSQNLHKLLDPCNEGVEAVRTIVVEVQIWRNGP